jgi:transcriptional regulator with XRE-family HTH domain
MTPRAMGRRIKTLREVRELSRQQLAQKADLNRETIRLLEAGRFDPTLRTLTKLAKALGVTLVDLVQVKRRMAMEPTLTEEQMAAVNKERREGIAQEGDEAPGMSKEDP